MAGAAGSTGSGVLAFTEEREDFLAGAAGSTGSGVLAFTEEREVFLAGAAGSTGSGVFAFTEEREVFLAGALGSTGSGVFAFTEERELFLAGATGSGLSAFGEGSLTALPLPPRVFFTGLAFALAAERPFLDVLAAGGESAFGSGVGDLAGAGDFALTDDREVLGVGVLVFNVTSSGSDLTEDLDVLADFGSGITAFGDGDLTLLRLVLGVPLGVGTGDLAATDDLDVLADFGSGAGDFALTEDLDVLADFGSGVASLGSGVTALGEGDLTLLRLVLGVPLGVGTGDLAATEDLDVLADFGSGVAALGDGDLTLLRLVLGVGVFAFIVTSSGSDLTELLEVLADFGSGVAALGEGDLTLLRLVLGVVLGVPLGVTAGDFAFTEDLDVLADFGSGSGVTAFGEGDLTLLRLVLGVALGDLAGAGDSLIVTSPSTDLTEDLDVFADLGSGVTALGDGDLTLLRLVLGVALGDLAGAGDSFIETSPSTDLTEDLEVLADFGSGVAALGDGDLTLLRLVLGVALGDLAGAGDSFNVTSPSTDLTDDLEVLADFGSGVAALGDGDLTLLRLVLGVALGDLAGAGDSFNVTSPSTDLTDDLEVLADFGSGVAAFGEGDLTLLRLVLGVPLGVAAGDLAGAPTEDLDVLADFGSGAGDVALTEDLDVLADFGSGVAALGEGDRTLLRLVLGVPLGVATGDLAGAPTEDLDVLADFGSTIFGEGALTLLHETEGDLAKGVATKLSKPDISGVCAKAFLASFGVFKSLLKPLISGVRLGDFTLTLRMGDFLAGVFLAGVFLAGVFLAGVFLAGVFLAGVLAGVFLAGVFLAGVLAGVFLAGVFLAGDLAGVFLAGVFLAGVLAGVFLAGVFLAGDLAGVFLAGDFLAGVLAGVFLAGVFLGVTFAGVFLALLGVALATGVFLAAGVAA